MSLPHVCPAENDFGVVCDACRIQMLENKALRKDFYGPKTEQFYCHLYFWMRGKVWWTWVDPKAFTGDQLVNWTTVDKEDFQFEILINKAQPALNETAITLARKMWENTAIYVCTQYAHTKNPKKPLY